MAKRAMVDIDGDQTEYSPSKRIKATATSSDITPCRPEATSLGLPPDKYQMAKGTIIDGDCGGQTERPSSKRMKATATACDTRPTRPEATFLGLPLELREEIYRNVCGNVPDVQDRPKHPFDAFPSNFDLAESTALLLLNQQTRIEVQALFNREYAGLIFYFEDIPALFDVHAELGRRHCLWDARFVLRTTNRVFGSPHLHGKLITSELPDLLHCQDGFKQLYQELSYTIGNEGRLSIPFGIEFHKWNERQEDLLLIPRYRHFCDTNGVVIEAGKHESCSVNSAKCRQYFEARYPDLHNSLRLKEFAWKPQPQDGYDLEIEGGVVLEGRIHDLNVEKYNIRRGRFRLAAYRGEIDWESYD